MPELNAVRTSLHVGFAGDALPARFASYRGKDFRSIECMPEFPYEDAQFDVVMLEAAAVSVNSVKEAHRVLKKTGYLLFIVPEKTSKQEGYTLPDIYAIVRDGFNIVHMERPRFWAFKRKNRTLTIFAEKKHWKKRTEFSRGGIPLSPFGVRT